MPVQIEASRLALLLSDPPEIAVKSIADWTTHTQPVLTPDAVLQLQRVVMSFVANACAADWPTIELGLKGLDLLCNVRPC